jgi:hypothetical protein
MCSGKLPVMAKTTTMKINFPFLPTPQILIHSIHQNCLSKHPKFTLNQKKLVLKYENNILINNYLTEIFLIIITYA